MDNKIQELNAAIQDQQEVNQRRADDLEAARKELADRESELAVAKAVADAVPDSNQDEQFLESLRDAIADKSRELDRLRSDSENQAEELANTQLAVAMADAEVYDAAQRAEQQAEKVTIAKFSCCMALIKFFFSWLKLPMLSADYWRIRRPWKPQSVKLKPRIKI